MSAILPKIEKRLRLIVAAAVIFEHHGDIAEARARIDPDQRRVGVAQTKHARRHYTRWGINVFGGDTLFVRGCCRIRRFWIGARPNGGVQSEKRLSIALYRSVVLWLPKKSDLSACCAQDVTALAAQNG